MYMKPNLIKSALAVIFREFQMCTNTKMTNQRCCVGSLETPSHTNTDTPQPLHGCVSCKRRFVCGLCCVRIPGLHLLWGLAGQTRPTPLSWTECQLSSLLDAFSALAEKQQLLHWPACGQTDQNTPKHPPLGRRASVFLVWDDMKQTLSRAIVSYRFKSSEVGERGEGLLPFRSSKL